MYIPLNSSKPDPVYIYEDPQLEANIAMCQESQQQKMREKGQIIVIYEGCYA